MAGADITGSADFRRLTFDLPERGGQMALLDLGDPGRPVDMVFVHANGFNARTYLELLHPLARTHRILAPDLRGHGGTRLPTRTEGRRGWRDHADDLVALLDRLDGPVVLAGHSMGGTSGLMTAATRPDRIRRLVLLDPVIWSRSASFAFGLPGLRRLPGRIPLVAGALKRRSRFDDRQQAFAAYLGRGAFRDWPDTMLRDYLADGLVKDETGLRLACAPEWEASNYAAQGDDPWQALDGAKRPVRILKAEIGSTCHAGLDARRGRSVEVVAGGTHFLPMTRSEIARAALADALETI